MKISSFKELYINGFDCINVDEFQGAMQHIETSLVWEVGHDRMLPARLRDFGVGRSAGSELALEQYGAVKHKAEIWWSRQIGR